MQVKRKLTTRRKKEKKDKKDKKEKKEKSEKMSKKSKKEDLSKSDTEAPAKPVRRGRKKDSQDNPPLEDELGPATKRRAKAKAKSKAKESTDLEPKSGIESEIVKAEQDLSGGSKDEIASPPRKTRAKAKAKGEAKSRSRKSDPVQSDPVPVDADGVELDALVATPKKRSRKSKQNPDVPSQAEAGE